MDIIDDSEIFKTLINNVKNLIDRNIYKFLFTLLYYIIIIKEKEPIEEDNSKKRYKTNEKDKDILYFKNLDNKIKEINDKYIKLENEKLNEDYTSENLINIVKFVKTQNNIYAGEILENILIIIFSFGFKTKRDNTFGKYIYNNIYELKNNYMIFVDWVNSKKIKTIFGIKTLLYNDFLEHEIKYLFKEEPLYNFLYEIYMEKENRKKIKKKIINYINNRIFDFHNKNIQITNAYANKDIVNNLDIYYNMSCYNIISNIIFHDDIRNGRNIPIGKVQKIPIPLIRSFLISVFIYSQNKNSNLMKYSKNPNNEENLEIIPLYMIYQKQL